MSILLPQTAVCPVLVGRSEQSAVLHRLIERTAAGESSVAVISGEAGIGKSRLVAEVVPSARHAGLGVHVGHCFEEDRSYPFAPLIDLMRSFSAAQTPADLKKSLGTDASEIVKLLPELASRVAGLSASARLNPEQEKQRLFRSLTSLFSRLASIQPRLVIIEDLHWSDETSLDCLLHLLRRLVEQPLFLLLTYRTNEDSATLSRFIAELDRRHVAVEINLTKLSRQNVDEMVRAIFSMGQPTSTEFLDSFCALTEGNPFFVEEVLKALMASGDIYYEAGEWTRKPMNELTVPRTVRDAVARRTEGLPRSVRQVLTLAAVAGRRFDFGLIQRLAGCDESTLLELIKTLISAQLVSEESAEQFSFRHSLTREAVYSELLERERMTLHNRVARTMEDHYRDSIDSHLAGLSYHFFEAGKWNTALAYAMQAGDRAQELYAHSEARQHYVRARTCAEKLGLPERLAEIDEAIGDVGFSAGEYLAAAAAFDCALQNVTVPSDNGRIRAKQGAAYAMDVDKRGELLLEAALDELDPASQANDLARALVWLARVHWHRMQYGRSIELCERALALSDRIDDPTTMVWIYRQLASTYSAQLELDKSIQWARKCVQVGERDAHPLQVHGYAMLAQSMLCKGDWRRGLKNADAMHDISENVGWLLEVAWANFFRTWALEGIGDLHGALAAANLARDQAYELSESRLTVQMLAFMARLHADLGELQSAHALGVSAVVRADELQETSLLSFSRRQLAHVHLLCEEWEKAHTLCELAADALAGAESGLELMQMGPDRAETLLAVGRLEEAEQAVKETLQIARRARSPYYEAIACRVQAQVTAAMGLRDAAQSGFDEAADALDRIGSKHELANALYQRGLLYREQGNAEAAHTDWERARTIFGRLGALPMLWRTCAALGDLAQRERDGDLADSAFADARSVVDSMASKMTDDALREQLFKRAARLIPPPRQLTPDQSMKRAYGGLTRREREVAASVASGMSNRAIADALVLSERTVEGHVSNILAKLDFSSRTQIASWAVSVGLVDGPDVKSSNPTAPE